MDIPEELKKEIEKQVIGIKSKKIIETSQIISNRYRNNKGYGEKLLTKENEAISYSISRMAPTYCAVSSVLKNVFENIEYDINEALDIGAGTGAATWAINERLNITKITCLERENSMISVGKKLMENTKLKNVNWKKFDVLEDEIDKTDLIVSSYMINELPENEIEQIAKKLWEATKKVLIIIEPGTPIGFNNILRIRNVLLKQGANIIAPCPHQNDCQLDINDWCSFYVRVSRSSIHKASKKGQLGYEDEKFSYIAVSKNKNLISSDRILRHPQIFQGYIKLKVCTQYGIKEIILSKKDGEIYKKAKKLDAGDILK